MQIESLRYFIELARAGSFYGAAKSALISQQGLNKAVSSLEAELGMTLVERTRRGVRLTHDGEVFLRHAKHLVADYDAMLNELLDMPAHGSDDVERVSAFVSYYGVLTASANPTYINMLAESLTYIEEPFDKLVERAANSDGTDLVYLDVHGRSLERLKDNPDVVFEPIVRTHCGFVWKDGSSLAGEPTLHRSAIAAMPTAVNTHREMAQFVDWLFRETPLQNTRMGATNPRMLLEYVRTSDFDAVATYDSFGFYLSQFDDDMPTEGLHFTPLSTPEAAAYAGFLYPRRTKLSLRARHAVGTLKRFLATTCGDYFIRYPVDWHMQR